MEVAKSENLSPYAESERASVRGKARINTRSRGREVRQGTGVEEEK